MKIHQNVQFQAQNTIFFSGEGHGVPPLMASATWPSPLPKILDPPLKPIEFLQVASAGLMIGLYPVYYLSSRAVLWVYTCKTVAPPMGSIAYQCFSRFTRQCGSERTAHCALVRPVTLTASICSGRRNAVAATCVVMAIPCWWRC